MSRKRQNAPQKAPKTALAVAMEESRRQSKGPAFAESTVSEGGLGMEIASRTLLLAMADLHGLPNPDPILRAEGRSISTYRSMVDGHLSAVMGKRIAAVRSQPWCIERGKASARDTAKLQQIFESLDVREMTTHALSSLGMGYSVQEIVWRMDEWIVPGQVINRPQEWFVFGLRGETRFLDDAGRNEIVPPRKLLIARHGNDYLNPYGKPILSECFWPLAFKRGGLKFWMLFCEKFGLPKTIGKVPANTSEADKLDLLIRLESMVRAAAAVIPENGKVELLESKTSGTLPFPDLVKWADSEMSKAWLGETLSTEMQGSSGSRAAVEGHNDVRADLALDDANLVEATMNELITWIWEINGFTGPKPWFAIQMPKDLKAPRLKRDKDLYAIGVRFTQTYFQETYDLAPEHIERIDNSKGAPTPSSGPAFGEPGDTSLRETVLAELEGALDASTLQGQADKMVGPVIDLIHNAQSFGEVAEGLAGLIDQDAIDTDNFEELLARMNTLAEGIGLRTDA